MTRLLLDSHVALWLLADDGRLGPTARHRISVADVAHVSVVTPWELGIKRSLGKVDYPDGLVAALVATGCTMLPIGVAEADLAPQLPMHHRDPFDRMLVAQAMTHGMQIVTADPSISMYDVPSLDAST